MMKRIAFLIPPVLVLLFAACMTSTPLESEEAVPITVLRIEGAPQIMERGSSTWKTCVESSPVGEGDQIRTGTGEIAELSIGTDTKNIIKVNENSTVVMRKSSTLSYSIELVNGEVFALLQNLPKQSTFEVKTPAGISGARGTGLKTGTDGAQMVAGAFEKSIFVRGLNPLGEAMQGELTVPAGWKTRVPRFQMPSKLEKMSLLEQRQWNTWKRDLSGRLEPLRQQANLNRASNIDKNLASALEKKESFNETKDTDRIEKSTSGSSGGDDDGGKEGEITP